MNQPPEDFGEQLEKHRVYLYGLAIASVARKGKLRAKLDPSGIVQDVFTEAVLNPERLLGRSDAEQRAYLRKALVNRLIDNIRRYGPGRRDYNREVPTSPGPGESSEWIDGLAEDDRSPIQNASTNEQTRQLAEALLRLSERERRALELHDLEGLTLAETAKELQTSAASVAGAVRDGKKKLRKLLSALRSNHDGC
jgi:RNA polymerase sigma-70 factor (subfamily 1)